MMAPSPFLRMQFRIRVYRGDEIAVGPGKVTLLETIAQTHSISAAARELGMSYRRAWLLVDEVNRSLKQPAVETAVGGIHGGGAHVTETGQELIRRYRAIEATAAKAASVEIEALKGMMAA